MEKRIYKVLDTVEAGKVGARFFSDSPYNRFALVAMRGEKLDNVVAWAYNKESLERKADERNKDIAMLGRMIGRASDRIEQEKE